LVGTGCNFHSSLLDTLVEQRERRLREGCTGCLARSDFVREGDEEDLAFVI